MLQLIQSCKSALKRHQLLQKENIHIVDPRKQKINFSQIHTQNKSNLSIGAKAVINGSIYLERDEASLSIGDNFSTGHNLLLSCAEKIEIGDNVMLGWNCTIIDHDAHSANALHRENDSYEFYYEGKKNKDWKRISRKSIKICDRAWIGFNTTIMKGVTIGEGAIITACSTVFDDVPPWTIVRGNPASIIRDIPKKWRYSGNGAAKIQSESKVLVPEYANC